MVLPEKPGNQGRLYEPAGNRRWPIKQFSKPLAKPIEVTGQMSATLWAATDAKDTDWNIMLLDVFPDGHAERVQDGVARARFRQGNIKSGPLWPPLHAY